MSQPKDNEISKYQSMDSVRKDIMNSRHKCDTDRIMKFVVIIIVVMVTQAGHNNVYLDKSK